jgi:hypothetical protein
MTNKGLISVRLYHNNNPIEIKSNDLLILLDYETASIVIKQELSSLISDDELIQTKLTHYDDQLFELEGKLGIDYINTNGHPLLDFTVEGTLSPGKEHIIGSGHLVHRVQGTSSACLLSLSFILNLDEVFPDNQMEGMNNEIYVNVIQSLMARENE